MKKRGIGTFPVRVGEATARRVDQVVLVLIYVVILWLVFVTRYFTPVMLIVFLAFKYALNAIKMLNDPRPAGAASGLRFLADLVLRWLFRAITASLAAGSSSA